MNTDNLTALQYLESEDKAMRNGVDQLAFRKIKAKLSRLPEVQERLAFEFLELAWQALDTGEDPDRPVLRAVCFIKSVSNRSLPQYVATIEKIVLRCFELMAGLQNTRFAFTVRLGLTTIHLCDSKKFDLLLERLRQYIRNARVEPLSQILASTVEPAQQKRARLQRLKRSIQLQQDEKERFLRSNHN